MPENSDNAFPWGNRRRFNSYTAWCIKKFGSRLQKLSVDAGFSCPNRDGSLGATGCSFCNNEGFNPSYCSPEKGLTQQIDEGLGFHQKRYRRAVKYIAYFQAYSNTYQTLEKLRELYSEALAHQHISGISIGTRPDCVDEEKLDYLAKLAENHFVSIEFGIESCNDQTLAHVRRGHTFAQSLKAMEMTSARNLQTGVHFIIGLPGEDPEYLLEQTKQINALPVHSIKFHQLQILKNTVMEQEYRQSPEVFHLYTLDEYTELIIDILERLRPGLYIERLCGEVPPRFLAVPAWGLIRNDEVIRRIEKRMEERDTWQGREI